MRIILVILLALFLASCQPSEDHVQTQDLAQQALDDAQRFAEKGEYEKSLERHVWFHENSLKIKPSYSGVRLSFALGYWVELGEKYPKALEKLKSIRDQKVSILVSGDYNQVLFQDVVAINDHLGEIEKTVELFEYFDGKNPKFAESIFDIADESLLKSKKYTLAKKYLGDPKKRFNIAKQNYECALEYYKGKSKNDISREADERIFTAEVIKLVTFLDKTEQRGIAIEIQAEALKILDNSNIRNIIPIKNTEQRH